MTSSRHLKSILSILIFFIMLIPFSSYADINDDLINAAHFGDVAKIKELLYRGADINARDNNDYTALMWTARYGHTEAIKVLLNRGAELNAKDNDGWTALMWAASNGDTEAVKLLIERGAELNAKSKGGNTALMYAAWQGHTEAVKLLIERGADVNAKDKVGNTALMLAENKDYTKIAEILRQAMGKGTTSPEIAITEPSLSRGVLVIEKTPQKAVIGEAKDASGISYVKINGKDVPLEQISGGVRFIGEIMLSLGDNTITVEAMNTKDNKTTKTFVIKRQGDMAVETPPVKTSSAGIKDIVGWYDKQYAIVIGIDHYKSSGIDTLKNAVNDAKAVAKMLIKMGFTVTELYNEKAHRKAVLSAIGEITKTAKKSDSFIFYFAGHGQGIALNNKEQVGYIISYDADINLTETSVIQYDEEAIPLNTVRKYANNLQAKHIALLLDSCFSGLAMKRSLPKLDNIDLEYYNDLLSRKAVNILTAGDDQPVSDGSGHSPFTQALLEALDRKGIDINDRDGFATFSQLAVYVKEKVEKATGRRQRPQFDNLSLEDGDFVFSVK